MLSGSFVAIPQSILILLSLLQSVLTSPIDTTPANPLQDRGLYYKTWGASHRVLCYEFGRLPDTSVVLTGDFRFGNKPPVTFERTADLCYANPTVNAGCRCQKTDEDEIQQDLVCDALHFKKPAEIVKHCHLACSCFIGGPDKAFEPSPDWFQQPKCGQKLVDDEGKESTGKPIYCKDDTECGDGCFCNGQEEQWYTSGRQRAPVTGGQQPHNTYTQLRLVLGAGLSNGLGVCGEKFRPAGTDGAGPV